MNLYPLPNSEPMGTTPDLPASAPNSDLTLSDGYG